VPTAATDLSEVLSDLRASVQRERPPAILFGAGASASPPAALPTAWGLLRAYRDRLADALRDSPDLAAGIPPLEEWTSGLRFEQVVSVFNRIGLALDALAPLEASHAPNENHRLLASLYLAEWPLVTTNFDVLGEIAILQAHGDLRQVVDRDDLERDESSPFHLHKLHGSFWKWRDERWLRSGESICATFEDLGMQYSRYLTNDTQKLLLVRLIRERPLIVVGYSAGDDFDISPIVLQTPREQPLFWVQHRVDTDGFVVATSPSEVPEGARQVVPTTLFRDGNRHAVTWIYGDTTALLRRLADDTGAPVVADGTVSLPECHGERALPTGLLDDEREAYLFAGMLMVELGKPLGAVEYLECARARYLAEGELGRAVLAAYEIARAYRAARDDASAQHSLKSCLLVAHQAGLPRYEALSLHFLGRFAATRSLAEAEQCFRIALTLIDRDVDRAFYGSVLGDLGDVLWRARRHGEAYELLVEAATIVESSGVLEEAALLQHKLAVWSIDAGHLDEARDYIRGSLELREKLGDLDATVAVLHELGMIEQKAGRPAEAGHYFEEVCRRAAEIDDPLSHALAGFHLGWLAYEQEDVERAETLERQSSAILERLGESYFLAHNLQLRAVLFLYHGQIEAGKQLLEEAIELSAQTDDAVNVESCTALLRQLERVRPREGTAFVVAAQ
jgi:tetratricopeptide (TPR) repeat protein